MHEVEVEVVGEEEEVFAHTDYWHLHTIFETNIDTLSTLLAPNHVLIIICMVIIYGRVLADVAMSCLCS